MIKRYLSGARRLAGGFIVLAGLQAAPATAAPSWPAAAYSYYAQSESLATVLQQFAGSFSLALQMTPAVSGVVNGRFNATSPTEFLDRLSGVYGFTWFVHAGTLYVDSSKNMVTRSVNAMGSSISGLHDALSQLGVLDARFGWGELTEQGIAVVSGPPAYVALIERTVAALPLGTAGQQVAVFRLKYASVNDRVVNYRSQTVVTPGMATMLRNLILGGADNTALTTVASPLRNSPPAFLDSAGLPAAPALGEPPAAPAPATPPPPSGSARAVGGGLRLLQPTVQADARLNAIVVKDIAERLPIYKDLIEQLDVPSTLIQIEAMIVDVNADQRSQLGVAWGATAGRATFGYGDLNIPVNGALPEAPLSPGTLGIAVSNLLAARIHALETNGQANILSQPSILTADNLGAIIDLSETFYIQTTGERVATVTPIVVGTSLRVTPRYIDSDDANKLVELTVDIEDGQIQEERRVGALPMVRKSNVSTLAIVADGETLLVGGYNSSQNLERTEKVPLLGSIPVIGALFSTKSNTTNRRERLFMLRPRVVAINGKPVLAAPSQAVAVNIYWIDENSGMYRVGGAASRLRSLPVRSAAGPFIANSFYVNSPLR